MLDIKTNYLSEIGCGKFTTDSLSIVLSDVVAEEKWIRKINKVPYVDPDSKCFKLYQDFSSYYNGLKLPNGNHIEIVEVKERNKGTKNSFYELIINIIKEKSEAKTIIAQMGLGSDYIGPSIYWACEAGMTAGHIGKYLETTRTFGGHIIWPRWIGTPKQNGEFGYQFIGDFKSINIFRGGENGLYDRIDLSLFDLKEWYLGQTCKLKFAYDKNKIWLDQFVDFEGFINFFKLNNYVCEKKYKIKNLSSYHEGDKFKYLSSNDVYPTSIPREEIAYSKFADASLYLIKLRNVLLNIQ